MLSGVVVTEPQNLNDNIASNITKLRQSGFSPKVVKDLKKLLGKDFESGRVSF